MKYIRILLDLLQNNKLNSALSLQDLLWLDWAAQAVAAKKIRAFCQSSLKKIFEASPESTIKAFHCFMEQKRQLKMTNPILEDFICDLICTNNPAAISQAEAEAFFQHLDEEVKKGDAIDGVAQTLLAECHLHGFGTTKDASLAKDLMETAALYNHRAQLLMGVFYQEGTGGLKQDQKRAFELYQQAVAPDKDHPGYLPAHELLAYCYENGAGTPKDLYAAKASYEDVAATGRPHAQYKLGVFHYTGAGGLKRNEHKALAYFKKAAAQKNPDACLALGLYYFDFTGSYDLLGALPLPTRAEPKSQAKAMQYFRIAAEQGDHEAEWRLGVCLYNGGKDKGKDIEGGDGIVRDGVQAFPWILKAAQAGLPSAQYQTGRMYIENEIPQDIQEAKNWFTAVLQNPQTHDSLKDQATEELVKILSMES